MIVREKFSNEEEKKLLIEKYNDLYIVKLEVLKDGSYIIFSDIPLKLEPTWEEKMENKISILEAENADLLLDSAIKDSKISTLENDLADLTLEIAMMEVR